MSILTEAVAFVGLDYHSAFVQVCVLDRAGKVLVNDRCENNARAIATMVRARVGEQARVFAAIEACCGAANLADELVSRCGWSVDQAHPGYVSRLKQSPDKTDFADARILADLERVGYLPKVWTAPHEVRELRRVVRYRQQLVQERRATKLRIAAALREARLKPPASANPWTKAWLAWLDRAELSEQARWVVSRQLERLKFLKVEIQEADQRLERLTQDDVLVRQLRERPGIGLITAATIRAEIGRFDRFRTGKQLARFCGLSPRNASSGQKQADSGLIKAGNSNLRAVIIEAAQRLVRYDERWTKQYCQLWQRGKPKCVALAAVANRWMRWLFHQVRPATLAA
jgi:transposase